MSTIEDGSSILVYQTFVWYLPAPEWQEGLVSGNAQGEFALIEKVQEPVEVLTKFVEGQIQPMRFRWRGRC